MKEKKYKTFEKSPIFAQINCHIRMKKLKQAETFGKKYRRRTGNKQNLCDKKNNISEKTY